MKQFADLHLPDCGDKTSVKFVLGILEPFSTMSIARNRRLEHYIFQWVQPLKLMGSLSYYE